MLPGVPDGGDFSLNAPVPKAAGDQNTVRPGQKLGGGFVGDRLAVHPADVHLHLIFNAAVGEGLGYRQIGVMEGHILAHQSNLHRPGGMFGPVDHGGPLGQVGHRTDQPQPPDHHIGQSFPLQHQGDLVEQLRR